MRLLFVLPALAVIWANLHGGFLLGILLICAYAGGELAGALVTRGSEDRRAAFGRSCRYGGAALGCLAASLINPYGWHLHLTRICSRFLSSPAYFQNIAEFTSISFRHPLKLGSSRLCCYSASRLHFGTSRGGDSCGSC